MKSTSRIFQTLFAIFLLMPSCWAHSFEGDNSMISAIRGGGDGPYPLQTIESLWQSLDGRFTLKIYLNTHSQKIQAIEILDNSRKTSLGWVQQILSWDPVNQSFVIVDSNNRLWQGQLWLPGKMNLETFFKKILEQKTSPSSTELQFWVEPLNR